MSDLPCHGEWQLECNQRVLIQDIRGAWNEPAIIQYMQAFREEVKPLLGAPWAMLSVLEDWQLIIPEAAEYAEAQIKWFKDNGCILDCHVYHASAIKKSLVETMAKDIPLHDEHYQHIVFEDFDLAVNWLAARRFSITETPFYDQLRLKFYK